MRNLNWRSPVGIRFIGVNFLLLLVLVRLIGLSEPPGIVFDEHHYVPAARVLIGLEAPQGLERWKGHDELIARSPDPNFSHPILGKFIIGLGIKLFGNNALGWRIMSALAGILSLVVFAGLVQRWWRRSDLTWLATSFLGLDFLHIIHSRIGMLDMFVFLFTVLLVYVIVRMLQAPEQKRWWLLAGAVAAFGFSVKHVMALTILFCFFLWWTAREIPTRTRVQGALTVALAGAGLWGLWSVYYMAHGYSFSEWLQFQMNAGSKVVGTLKDHRYGSAPAQWLFNGKPVWYFFKGGVPIQGICAVGNPAVWLTFLPATALLVHRALVSRDRREWMPIAWFWLSYLPLFWILWQRQGFIYHMLPATAPMALTVARAVDVTWGGRRAKFIIFAFALAFTIGYMPLLLGLKMSQSTYNFLRFFTGV